MKDLYRHVWCLAVRPNVPPHNSRFWYNPTHYYMYCNPHLQSHQVPPPVPHVTSWSCPAPTLTSWHHRLAFGKVYKESHFGFIDPSSWGLLYLFHLLRLHSFSACHLSWQPCALSWSGSCPYILWLSKDQCQLLNRSAQIIRKIQSV